MADLELDHNQAVLVFSIWHALRIYKIRLESALQEYEKNIKEILKSSAA